MTRRYARRTQRLSRALWHLAQISGAKAGSDLAKQLKIVVARDTLLRLLRRDAVFVASQARMIGVDDWAKKRGQDYGSILVDLEAHRVIDLLPNRQADALAAWLSQHPEIQLVTRDRSKEYAYGIQKGAPQAVQVADRWHLLKNISEMSERALLEIYPRLKKQPEIPVISAIPLRDAFPRSQKDLERKVLARQQRLQKYSQIQYLKARGYGQRQIARLLSLSRATVRAYYLAETFPERKVSYRPSQLDPYIPHLQQRWEEGCRKAQILWQEILELGYVGKVKQVMKWMQNQRQKASSELVKKPEGSLDAALPLALPAFKDCLRVLTRVPEKRTEEDTALLGLLRRFRALDDLYQLVQAFIRMVRQQEPDLFDPWLELCSNMPIAACRHFAEGLKQDYDAVQAALILPHSNGQTEGQVNRLKVLKRQMYGRAKLDLLKLRLMYSSH